MQAIIENLLETQFPTRGDRDDGEDDGDENDNFEPRASRHRSGHAYVATTSLPGQATIDSGHVFVACDH